MKKTILALAASAFLMTPLVGQAQQADLRDVVKDNHGNIVKNNFDNCVRTRWESGADACTAAGGEVIDREALSVYFAFDSAELTPAAMAKLDTVASVLGGSQAVGSVNIVGYADSIGNTDYNYNLSKRRADAVRNYLSSRGYLKTNAVEVRALGEEAPVSNCGDMARNEKIACLWRDRRVEIELNVAR
jgi:OOP family OmpA-OmpF porin